MIDNTPATSLNPLDRQIGGDHYKNMTIQPVVYIHQNQLGFLAGCVIKRIARYNKPGGKGVQDLQKSIHELDLLIAHINAGHIGWVPTFRLGNLPISPDAFSNKNGFSDMQWSIITLVTKYNLYGGNGREDLIAAKKQLFFLMTDYERSVWDGVES